MSILSRISSRYQGHPFRLLSATLKTVFITHLFWTYGYTIEPCAGASMLPTIPVLGNSVLIARSYRLGRNVKVGDVIAFDSVVEPGQHVIKRVIGMEGDFVLRDTPGIGDTMIQIPKGHCWVVGDNLPYSRDSRHFGPMPMALIRGKVLARVLPWKERCWIDDGLQLVD